ncbi:hypothetical protein FOL47_006116 [Perkinsus chesapeaki]|uniref:WW domain-containing protein n=1 Tax=Perkinsus chesapeaki TaxID=330153 RepID=A0A7J6MXW4_PERCH|nr:hypothetical protein FOL47_006116 [Perkinsus chesapeaki]
MIKKRHRVQLFGHLFESKKSLDEQSLYRFRHRNSEGYITEGEIPVNFRSILPTESGANLYLTIREGRGRTGPEYAVSWQTVDNVIADYNSSLDDTWSWAVGYLEKKGSVSLAELDYLDADPFILFGIDDSVTQRALRRLQKQVVLLCTEDTPSESEWMEYLCMDPEADMDHMYNIKQLIKVNAFHFRWVVEAFSEAELPMPWTSYKGIGSIVCFTNSETRVTTWQHPMYDYFRQLLEYSRTAEDREDILRIRVHRLLWGYEFIHSQPGAALEPLVSPLQLQKLGKIFGVDLAQEGHLVRTLKKFLKIFAEEYQQYNDISKDQIVICVDTLTTETERWEVLKENWKKALGDAGSHNIDVPVLANGKITCVECAERPALSYCLECRDHTCHDCYDKLHQKGHRSRHTPFKLVCCSLCGLMPARLRCQVTDKCFCHDCYAMKHIQTLSMPEKEMQPFLIDYVALKANLFNDTSHEDVQLTETGALAERQYQAGTLGMRGTKKATIDDGKSGVKLAINTSRSDDEESWSSSIIGSQWHPFYDSTGIMYYFNFATGEKMRRSPVDPNAPGSDDDDEEESSSDEDDQTTEGSSGSSGSGSGSDSHSSEVIEGELENEAKAKYTKRIAGESKLLPPRMLRPPYRIRDDLIDDSVTYASAASAR